MSYSPLGQLFTQLVASSPKPSVVVTAPKSVVVTPPKPSVVPARRTVVPAKQVTSRDRVHAASVMSAKLANRIRQEKAKAPAGLARQSLESAENRLRSLALMLATKRMSLLQALNSVSWAQREVAKGQLPSRTLASLLAALQALRAVVAPPARSRVTVAPPAGRVVTAPHATTIQSAVDAAISALAAAGTPVTEATVKQTATEIIKDVAEDATQAKTMVASLSESPLVVSGTAKTSSEDKPVETLTSTPLTTESVTSLVESAEQAPPAPEPEAEKQAEPAPAPTPDDLVAAPPPPATSEAAPSVVVAPAAAESAKEGLFGVPWLYVGLGAGALVVGGIIMSRRSAPTPNRRKRSSKRRSR